MKHVVAYFVRLRWYYVLVIPIDSAELGEPVRRPRYYFVLLRKDVGIVKGRKTLADFAKAMLVAARAPRSETVTERMLPTHHPVVRDYLARRSQVSVSRSKRVTRGQVPKWIKHHADFSLSRGLSGSVASSAASSGIKGLTLPRTHAVWNLLTKAHASPSLVADVSQNVHRAAHCLDGSAPTITPGGIIAVKKAGRIMVPAEKLLAHNFPLHNMSWPPNMSDKDVEDLGGNTMHLAAVGLALLIGIAGVNWAASAAKVGQKPCGAAPPAEAAIYIETSGVEKSERKRRMPLPAVRNKARRS